MNFVKVVNFALKVANDMVKRTVVAFANGEGGTIYIGVDDNGEVLGLTDADVVCQKITSSCRNAIRPDITMFLKVERMTMDGKEVVAVKVGGGSAAPYYLADKGMKPSGVFIRVGTSTVQASEAHIRNMIKLSDKESFVELRSLKQDLTFDAADKTFSEAGIAFGEVQKVTLGLIGTDVNIRIWVYCFPINVNIPSNLRFLKGRQRRFFATERSLADRCSGN